MNRESLALVCLFVLIGVAVAEKNAIKITNKDMLRRSIVFNKKTPDVFYCPVNKPTGFSKLIVQSRPLHKLCEHEDKPLPEDYKSDCYQDVDETPYACKEKYRIMMRMHPPGSEEPYNGTERMAHFMNVDKEIIEKMAKH